MLGVGKSGGDDFDIVAEGISVNVLGWVGTVGVTDVLGEAKSLVVLISRSEGLERKTPGRMQRTLMKVMNHR